MSELKLHRKRKTKAPCPGCYLHQSLCICESIPILQLKTKIALIVHAKELKRTTNTGRLALRVLVNSEMRVRGEGRERLNVSDILDPRYRSFVFYPSLDAIELTSELVHSSEQPIQLIVPDGNWRQASKVHSRHEELRLLPRVKISSKNQSEAHLRAETTESGMATLEAIAHALRIIEGEEVFEKIIGVYNAKLRATLIGRGQAVHRLP
jgi:DTW domain-containing protein YfiP